MIERYEKQIKNNPLMVAIKFARYKFIAKLLQKEDRVLEIGCNDGVSSNFFSQYCKSVDAIDLDDKAVKEASDNFPHINFKCVNALTYNFEKKYDVIIMLDFIEHFTKDDGEKLLEKYSQLLSNRGMIMVGTPSKYFEEYRAEHNKLHHLHEYYPEELEELMYKYFNRTMMFSMNDEVVHTGNLKLAWFIYSIGSYPRNAT